VGGNPGATVPDRNFLPDLSIVTGENTSDGDFVTLVRKKRVNNSAVANTTKKPMIPTIGVRNSSSLSVVQKMARRKSVPVSLFSPVVKIAHVKKYFKRLIAVCFLYLHQIRN
jgi:hypothetical protein